MPRDPLIGIVGKPSSGKSTTYVKVKLFMMLTVISNQSEQYETKLVVTLQIISNHA
jgi:hypothetical protein